MLQFFGASSTQALASQNIAQLIDTVIVIGNHITHRSVILHEIELTPGKVVDDSAIDRDRLRLESLGLFSRVEISIQNEESRTQLVIKVVELWYIWPGIYISVDNNRPTEKIDYGFLISHLNFRGRAEDMSITGWTGSSMGGKLRWSVPYVRGNRDWFAKIEGKGNIEEDPASITGRKGIETEDLSVQGEFGRRFGLTTRLWLTGGLEARTFNWDPFNTNGINNNTLYDSRDLLSEIGIYLSHDTRIYRPWPRQGELSEISVLFETSLDDDYTKYIRPNLILSAYRSLNKNLIFAGQVESGMSFGDVPWYRDVLLDRHSGIRTPLKNEYEGIHYLGFSGEFRGDLLPITYVTFNTFEPLQDYTHDLKFGISYALFSDYKIVGGEIDNPFDPMINEKQGWDVAYGAGIIFHIPYREIIRIEFSRSARFPELGNIIKLRIGPSF